MDAFSVPALNRKLPFTSMLSCSVHPPPEPLNVRLLKVVPPDVMVMPPDVESNVTMPVFALKVPPVLLKLPKIDIDLFEQSKVPLFIRRSPCIFALLIQPVL